MVAAGVVGLLAAFRSDWFHTHGPLPQGEDALYSGAQLMRIVPKWRGYRSPIVNAWWVKRHAES
ncbi:unnamed protein product [marine sediment metagenome]|uniref:Uncharacterized protein n=1 Tax=marine sediment metagenome TaxID=412755 RepID=X1DB57_9ZZZZ